MFAKRVISSLIAFVAFFAAIDSKPSSLDIGNACAAQYLVEKDMLEIDFPISSKIDEEKCKLVMPVIMKSLEKALCIKLSEKESIKTECVMELILRNYGLEYLLKHEVITMTKDFTDEEVKIRLEIIKDRLRLIFENASRECNSDPTYGGVFDDVLEIRNESLAVLRQNYCFTKFAVETKLLEVKEVDFNPKKIVTSNLDCQAMIKSNRLERERKMLETLKNRDLTEEQMQCVKDKYQIERAFDSNLALEVISYLDVAVDVRRTNRENIARRLESFIKSMFICFGKSTIANAQSISRVGDIMQF